MIALSWLLILASHPAAEARVKCPSAAELSRAADDDLCQALQTGADECYAKLIFHFHQTHGFVGKSSEERRGRVDKLKADYAHGEARLTEYLRELRSLGQGRACLDQVEYVDEFLKTVKSERAQIDRF